MRAMSSAVPGRWVHSREEDTEHVRTYRPSHWSLPLSRVPRHLLELEPNGRVVSYVGGAADCAQDEKAGGISIRGIRTCFDSSGKTLDNLR